MSGKLEIILCCNAAQKSLPITMCQSGLTVKLLNCQSSYQRSVCVGGSGDLYQDLQIDQ